MSQMDTVAKGKNRKVVISDSVTICANGAVVEANIGQTSFSSREKEKYRRSEIDWSGAYNSTQPNSYICHRDITLILGIKNLSRKTQR